MSMYDTRLLQAVENVGRELKLLRRDVEAIRNRLATPGGLTAATTRRAHLVIDGDKQQAYCSACGGVHGAWEDDIEFALMANGEKCNHCGAILRGDPEFVSGSGNG